jgi:hypothetical protein
VREIILAHDLLEIASSMGLFRSKITVGRLCDCHSIAVWLALGMFALGPFQSTAAAQPVLGPLVWSGDPLHAQISLANCSNTNAQYVIQMSTNLTDWITVITNHAVPTNFSVTVPTPYRASFYRVMTIPAPAPIFRLAIAAVNYFNANGNGVTIDSFDSSNTNYSTAGQWDFTKRKANGSVAAGLGVIGDINIGNMSIYGHVYTGPGTSQSDVQIGANGAVGDLAWNASNSGIEPGYWVGNFNIAIPDVIAPTFPGMALPAPTNGKIVLNGGNYTAPSGGPTSPLVITASTTLWVQGSFSPVGILITNGGSLVLYVGKATGSGDSLNLLGNGTINQPGLATNLQMYGLPSLTSLSLSGFAGFIGVIYAPEADFSGGGGSNNALDSSGSLVVNSVTLSGHWNFHYDESLQATGPFH